MSLSVCFLFLCVRVCVWLQSELMLERLNEWQCFSVIDVKAGNGVETHKCEDDDEDVLLSSTPLPSSGSSCISSLPVWQEKLKSHNKEYNLSEHLKRNFFDTAWTVFS